MPMQMTFRWYGEGNDKISLSDIKQIPGVTGIVWALHHKMPGEIWEIEEIAEVKAAAESGDQDAVAEELGDLLMQVIFHARGTLNQFLELFGVQGADWLKSPYCQLVIVVLFLWKNLGYNMILFMAAIANIPKELLEVADVEGASAAHKFFHIKLRYLSPTVLFVTILSMINCFKIFREVYLLAGAYPYEGLYTLQHFMNNTFLSLSYQKLSAAAVILALVMILLIALLFKVEDIFGKDVEG